MTPSTAPAKPGYKLALAFFALFSIALFTACQVITGNPFGDTPTPDALPLSSFAVTPAVRATLTHLPGDVYFLYQTETAAPTDYHPGRWPTADVFKTTTPQYGLTATVIAITEAVCLLAYPDFCISPNVRLSCATYRDRGQAGFTVLPPDPYGYDRDGDGIGCELDK